MKVGIIVHSQGGYTALVAKMLADTFREKGIEEVDLVLLRTSGKVAPRSSSFELKTIPSVKEYDIVLLGGPVWAFTASPVILKYVEELEERMSNKKLLCFVTKGLPFHWTGGTQALKAITEPLILLGPQVLEGEIIWSLAAGKGDKLKAIVNRMVTKCLE